MSDTNTQETLSTTETAVENIENKSVIQSTPNDTASVDTSHVDELYGSNDTVPQGVSQQENQVEIPTEYKFSGVDGVELQADEISAYTNIAQELKLTQEQAQKLSELGGNAYTQLQMQRVDAMSSQWFDEIQNDSELGGSNFDQTKLNLGKAMNHYGSGELRQLLQDTRLGSHPAVVRFFNAIGKDLSDDNKFISGQSAPQKVDPLRSIYNNSPNLK